MLFESLGEGPYQRASASTQASLPPFAQLPPLSVAAELRAPRYSMALGGWPEKRDNCDICAHIFRRKTMRAYLACTSFSRFYDLSAILQLTPHQRSGPIEATDVSASLVAFPIHPIKKSEM